MATKISEGVYELSTGDEVTVEGGYHYNESNDMFDEQFTEWEISDTVSVYVYDGLEDLDADKVIKDAFEITNITRDYDEEDEEVLALNIDAMRADITQWEHTLQDENKIRVYDELRELSKGGSIEIDDGGYTQLGGAAKIRDGFMLYRATGPGQGDVAYVLIPLQRLSELSGSVMNDSFITSIQKEVTNLLFYTEVTGTLTINGVEFNAWAVIADAYSWSNDEAIETILVSFQNKGARYQQELRSVLDDYLGAYL